MPQRDFVAIKGRDENRRPEFISMTQDSRRALSCGITTMRDEVKISGSVMTKVDELNMDEANQHDALRTFMSYRTKIIMDHREAIKSMVSEDPFLGYLNLTTDDLPLESDSSEVDGLKRKKIYESLLNSFSLMEQQSQKEIKNLKEESDLKELRSLEGFFMLHLLNISSH